MQNEDRGEVRHLADVSYLGPRGEEIHIRIGVPEDHDVLTIPNAVGATLDAAIRTTVYGPQVALVEEVDI